MRGGDVFGLPDFHRVPAPPIGWGMSILLLIFFGFCIWLFIIRPRNKKDDDDRDGWDQL